MFLFQYEFELGLLVKASQLCSVVPCHDQY